MNDLGGVLTNSEYLPLKSTGGVNILRYCYNKLGKEIDIKEFELLRKKKKHIYTKLVEKLSHNDLIPGIENFLKDLKKNKIKTAVASSSIQAEILLKKFDLAKYFDVIIDGNSNLPLKPNPDMFLKACEKINKKPFECIVFEDSIAGVESAKRGGFKCIGVGDFLKNEVELVIDDFSEAGIFLLK